MPTPFPAVLLRPDTDPGTAVPASVDAGLIERTQDTITGHNTPTGTTKEPWETFLGTLAVYWRRGSMYAAIPATAITAGTVLQAGDDTGRLLACVAVTAALAAFISLRAGWRLGCDQGWLDHVRSAQYHAAAQRREAVRRRMAFKLPRKPHGEGYLYVVGFSTGSVKVGQTEDPHVRLAKHRSDAAAVGVHVTDYWISPSHYNFKANETRLINACVRVSQRTRKEYFHEVGYARARRFAQELTYFSKNTEQTSVEGVWA